MFYYFLVYIIKILKHNICIIYSKKYVKICENIYFHYLFIQKYIYIYTKII